MKKIIVISFIILFTQTLYSAMPYAFLEYGVGSSDLSKTGIVSAESSAASFYNPALLVNKDNQIMAGYSIPFNRNFFLKEGETGIEGIGIYSLGISYSKEKYGIGMSGLMLKNNDLTGYDDDGNETGSFSTYEVCLSFGYGMKLNNRLNIGINNKIIYQRLYEGYSRVLAAIGIGIERKINSRLYLTGIIDNLINYRISGDNTSYETPKRGYGIGMGYNIGRFNLSATLLSDLEDVKISTGFNMGVMKYVELFGGIKDSMGYYSSDSKFNALSNLSTMNIGVKFNINKWGMDYSMGYQGTLGIKHTICGTYRY